MTRPVGRVKGGLKFTNEQVAVLPETGSAAMFADALGVTLTTMRRWIKAEGAPYTHSKITQVKYKMNKVDFVRWMALKGFIQ